MENKSKNEELKNNGITTKDTEVVKKEEQTMFFQHCVPSDEFIARLRKEWGIE